MAFFFLFQNGGLFLLNMTAFEFIAAVKGDRESPNYKSSTDLVTNWRFA